MSDARDDLTGDLVEPAKGLPTESKLFFGFGAFAMFLAVVYGLTSDGEWAGTVGLAFAGTFGLALGVFLARMLPAAQADLVAAEDEAERRAEAGDELGQAKALFLPTSSPWPIGIGIGVSLMGAGMSLGWWFLLPGLAVFAFSVLGFAAQSRSRRLT